MHTNEYIDTAPHKTEMWEGRKKETFQSSDTVEMSGGVSGFSHTSALGCTHPRTASPLWMDLHFYSSPMTETLPCLPPRVHP